jgi:hypothetical protein
MNIQPTTLQITSLKGLPHIDFLPLLGFYDFENEKTLTSCLVISRKNSMKLGMQVVNFRNHYVVNDILATLFTGIKIFFEIDTFLIKHTFTRHRKPLTTFGRRAPNFFYCARHLYYLSHHFMTHRNVKVRVLPKTNGYRDVSFFRRLRPMNRMLFFTLLLKLKNFSFRLPLWMTQRKWNSKSLQIYYIGFKVKIKQSTIARGLFRAISKRKYLLSPFNVFPRCMTSRRYYHYLREWAVYYANNKQQSFFKAFNFKRFVKNVTMLANRAYSFATIRIRRNIKALFVFNNKRLKSKLDEFAFWATQKWVPRREAARLQLPLINAKIRLNQLIKGIKFNRDSLLDIKPKLIKRLNKIERLIDGLKRAKKYKPCLGSRNRAIQTKNELRTYLYNRANLPMRFKLTFLRASVRAASKTTRLIRRYMKLIRRSRRHIFSYLSLTSYNMFVRETLASIRNKFIPSYSLKHPIRAHRTFLRNELRTHYIERTRARSVYSRLLRSRLKGISPAVKGANMSMSRHRGAIIAALPKRKIGQLKSIRARYPRRIRSHLIQSNPSISSSSNFYPWRRRIRDFYLRRRRIRAFYYWISRMRSIYSHRMRHIKLAHLKRIRLARLKRIRYRYLMLARLKRIRYHYLKRALLKRQININTKKSLRIILTYLNKQRRIRLIQLKRMRSSYFWERRRIRLSYPRERALIMLLHPARMRTRLARVDSVDIKRLYSLTKPRFRLGLTRWLYSSSKPRLIQKNFHKVIRRNRRYRVKYYRRYRNYNRKPPIKPSIKPRRRLTRCFHKVSKSFVNKIKYGSRRAYRKYFKIPSLSPSVKTRQGENEDSYFTFNTYLRVSAILHKVFVMNNPSIKYNIKSKAKICKIYP